LIEEYLEDNNHVADLVDYQFWCFNGELAMINSHLYFYNDNKKNICRFFFDHDFNLLYKDSPDYNLNLEIIKPERLSDMIRVARNLSTGIPFARIDIYDTKDKLIFGEITLSPSAGNNDYLSLEHQIYLGKLIDIDIVKKLGVY
jgi:hypothetical protein